MELKVIKVFKDKNNPKKIYQTDETLSIDDVDRVNDLVLRKLCVIIADNGNKKQKTGTSSSGKVALFDREFELKEVKEALVEIGISVSHNAGMPSISKKISELTDEQLRSVEDILCKE